MIDPSPRGKTSATPPTAQLFKTIIVKYTNCKTSELIADNQIVKQENFKKTFR